MKLKWMSLLLCIAMLLCVVGCNTTNNEKTPTTEPEVTAPEVTKPEVTEPEVTEPKVTEPEVIQPEVTEPEVTEPEVTEPEVTEPEITEPEVTEPEVTEPEVTEPEVTEPEVTEPEVTEPEVTEPEVTDPEVTEPEVTDPEVTDPEVTEPEVTEPEVTEPAVTEPEVTEPEEYIYDLKDFTIVRPQGYLSAMDDAVAKIYDKLVELGIEEPGITDDYKLSADPTRKEILIGGTNQPASEEAKKVLTKGNQYVIAFYENKIVIQVQMEEALSEAADTFIEDYLSQAVDGVLKVEPEETVVKEAGFQPVTLFSNSEIHYNIVLPKRPTKLDEALATAILERLELCTGNLADVLWAGDVAYNANTKSILIGNVGYPESEAVYEDLARNEYALRVVGNKLVLAGQFAMLREEACNLLLREMAKSMDNETKSTTLCVTEDWKGTEERFWLDFPEFTDGIEQINLDNENQTLMLGYTGVSASEFSVYYAKLEAEGYTLWQENQIGQNFFRTYRRDGKEICLCYYSKQSGGTMHLFSDGHNVTTLIPDTNTEYEKITEATLHVMSLDYSHRTLLDGHGMNYVITLEDGRYIVMDGGYNSASGSKDAQRIYEYLVKHNKREDGKVVIAAWFMSHPHGDHYGAFESFAAKYNKDVTLEYFIANPYAAEMGGGTHWFLTTMPGLLTRMNAKLIKPHTGQIMTFCNTELEVIYTHENLYPKMITDSNNTSTVLRMKQNGHTVIFTGDASVPACNMMVKLYGDELKSDMFQVNHHGCSGGTWALYDAATREDSYVLWTCSKEAFFYRTLGYWVEGKTVASTNILEPNRDLALKVGFENCFYADGVVEQITFPLDGEIQISDIRDYAKDPTTLKDESEMETYPGTDTEEPTETESEEVTEPEVTEPEVTEPEVTEPEVTEPEDTEPEVTEPEVIKTTADILTKTVYLFEGDSFKLNYIAKDEDLEIDWQVSTGCAEMRDNKVYAIKEGYAVISAGEDSVCSVKILPKTMPELYVATYGQKITSKEDYVTCDVTMLNTNEDYSFEYVPAGIRLRGNSTMNTPKKPYRIKFDSKINLLGMNDGAECKSWVLLAEWFDDSLIRNTTALSLAGSILEEYSSDWRYVKLILNGEDKGVYVLAEQSQINKYRVNIEEAGADTDALRSGYFYEVEGSKVDEGKFFISYENLGITTFLGNPYNVQSTDVQADGQRRWGYFLELKNDDTSAEQIAFAEKYAQNIFTLIYSATYKNICYVMDENLDLVLRDDLTPEEAISMAVDIDSMARMYIYLEMVCNFDAFKKSSYFYVDFSEDGTGKLTFACPWDHDRAFVKSWDAIEHVDVDKYFTAERSVLYVMMMNHEWFRAKVGDVWEEVAVNSRGFQNALDILEQLCDVYADDFAMETELWERENAQKSWAMATYDWLKVRIEWLDEQFMAMKQS